ncbi:MULTISPECIES: helix-turn-helix domain-containing protein [Enterococcus]|uniref:Helix-turn-helix transcriptional regulator n=1 Tax=Enterococcus gallinarum TaxID=1353 RepID=A0ABD4HNI4_ENTGA|nr:MULTISPECIES: helix-turn-helix transcriptional regulator [Enterococcus]MBA0947966.1 helix-turn-helix transcriptional regulator [Enterococcus gallinarum]MBA0961541.1 helix-turn-helix transcriptional regulator [Enterococcus gallinarum]MBA0969454.1 helix-turn-helix transcriptional regulator [Enterococcus gallinarum]MBA0972741.1 helix-turn-helix transcriptional regulator [Enterococcus gallinarum]NVI96315.1 helix-turn-helix transcriptional regulator [Enterococcus gallinarum]
MSISEKIKVLRIEKGWSQKKLAEMLNVSSQAISNWERGQSSPDISNIIQLSDLFDITLDELIKEDINFKEELIHKNLEKKISIVLSSIILIIFIGIFGYFIFNAIKRNFKEINYFALSVSVLGIIYFIKEIQRNN